MANTDLFSRLRRLFSTDVIVRNVGGHQLKVIDTDRTQAYGSAQTNSLVDRFTRLHRTSMSAMFNPAINYQTLRTQLYNDYEAMDSESIIASALDIVADETTLKNEAGEILQIRSSNERVQKVLYNLFYDILNIEFNLWPWTRQMCKYGDFYLFLEINSEMGVYNVMPLSSYELARKEGLNPQNPFEVYYEYDPNALASTIHMDKSNMKKRFENYEVAHFRLYADANYLPYGRSFIEPARKVYKQYTLMKDAMLIHRIMRSPEKRIFYVDVGGIPAHEVDNYMERITNKMKKTPFMDAQTGDYNLRYNIQNSLEDFIIPVRGANQNTKIDTLKGLEYNGIEDVNFLRDEMLAALKVPKAFFGFEKDLTGKATLAAEDIRFARTIERVQKVLVSELYKIALVHLYTQGFDGDELTGFELTLTPPSIIYQQEQVAMWKEKVSLAKDALDTGLIPSDFIYDRIFQFSEDQFDEMRDLVLEDKKRAFRLQQVENEGNDPAKTGRSFGTPHDLASLYGKGRSGNGAVPVGYDEKDPVGRPTQKASIFGTQKSSFGKDPIGSKEYNMTATQDKNPMQQAYKGGSPLALKELKRAKEAAEAKTISLYEDTKPVESDLLNENNIKGIEK
jgi:hypothetical protein